MKGIDLNKRAQPMGSTSKTPFRFGGMVKGENADAWVYDGLTDKAMVVTSPTLGVLRFAKSKLKNLETGFPECDLGFAEWVVEQARTENALKGV